VAATAALFGGGSRAAPPLPAPTASSVARSTTGVAARQASVAVAAAASPTVKLSNTDLAVSSTNTAPTLSPAPPGGALTATTRTSRTGSSAGTAATTAGGSAGGGHSRGRIETELMKSTISDQLDRLFTQLEDLEELKSELEPGEYDETKAETLAQLREFQQFMDKAISGDMTLVDEFGSAQLAIQAAISQAFRTPEVIRMFANKAPDQLRERFTGLQREAHLKHITQESYKEQAAEILFALKSLGNQLSSTEQNLLDSMSSARHLESAADRMGTTTERQLTSAAQRQIKQAAS